MGFRSKPSLEQLEERKEYLTVENEVVSGEVEIAEKEAIIKELKKKYGSSWKNLLGLKGRLNIQTLRSVLAGPRKGLQSMAGTTYNPGLSPLPGRSLRR